MFENITKFLKKFSKNNEKTANNSKNAAKERLHLVLMQDRANVSADFLELMKQEIIEVIKKYIDVDEKAIDVRLTNKENGDGTNGAPALYANIPIINIKNEARKVEARKVEAKKVDTKEIKEESKETETSIKENNKNNTNTANINKMKNETERKENKNNKIDDEISKENQNNNSKENQNKQKEEKQDNKNKGNQNDKDENKEIENQKCETKETIKSKI